MRVVVQRVSSASVVVEERTVGTIGKGVMILLGITHSDSVEDIDYLIHKIINLRIFDDSEGVMNVSLKDIGGSVLVVSQFTLHASTKKGNRPSYIRAARPNIANELYEEFKLKLSTSLGRGVESGVFGADMKCSLVNDGPVTIIIDTENKE